MPQDFVDRVRVHVRGGSGGQGSRRLGRSGGDGGGAVPLLLIFIEMWFD